MKLRILSTMVIAAVTAVALTVACGGDDNDDNSRDNSAAGGGSGTMPVTQALLDSLPGYDGATLVREWLAEGNSVQVREYAVSEPPAQAADSVTRHFRDALVAEGWVESEARAAVSSFTKDERRIVIGRVGPELQEPPAGTTLLGTADAPAGSAFYFTLEAEE
jgi:hypothetical protein